jgi:hypothetical protein
VSKTTRLVLAAVLVELIAAAIIIPSIRWSAISTDLSGASFARRADIFGLIVAFAAPLALAGAWAVFEKRLSAAPSLSSPHRGYAEGGILAAAFFLMAYQGWFASHLGQSEVAPASGELALRAATIFAGMVWAVHGNFAAKTPAPSGLGAPDPVVWMRVKSRTGWIMVLAGVAVAVCAIILPFKPLGAVFILVGLSVMGSLAVQRRALRRAPAP